MFNEWKGLKMLLDPENQGGGQKDAGRNFRFARLGLLLRLFRSRTNRLDVGAVPDSLLRDIGWRDGRRLPRSGCSDELRLALLHYPPRSV